MIKEFKAQSIFRIEDNYNRIIHAISMLSEDEIWNKPNNYSNSIGNLILHVCGNLNQFILVPYGISDSPRNRPFEFNANKDFNKPELKAKLKETINSSCSVISELSPTQLTQKVTINGSEYSGVGMMMHATQHVAYHAGQIMYWTKILKNKDLAYKTVLKKDRT